MKKHTQAYVKELTKQMRREPTPAEEKLWIYLRRNSLLGLKFYRQYPIGRYIADFCCPQKKLIVELDGGVHESERSTAYDELRDQTLHLEGMDVLRLKNETVLGDVEAVLVEIKARLTAN